MLGTALRIVFAAAGPDSFTLIDQGNDKLENRGGRLPAPWHTSANVLPRYRLPRGRSGVTSGGMGSERTGRHFTVAVFVVWKGKVLLHFHRKLGMWLPPVAT